MIQRDIKSYYNAGNISYTLSAQDDPMLDSEGWLAIQVFQVKATPDEAFKVCLLLFRQEVVLIKIRSFGEAQFFSSPYVIRTITVAFRHQSLDQRFQRSQIPPQRANTRIGDSYTRLARMSLPCSIHPQILLSL